MINECKEVLRNIEESQKVLWEAEESVEKSDVHLSKDQHSVIQEVDTPVAIHTNQIVKTTY